MMRLARVRKIFEDGTAQVLPENVCFGNCHKCATCQQKQSTLLRAKNPIHAKPGELVLVRTEKMAGGWYLLPVGLSVGAYALGALAACLGFALGLALVSARKRTHNFYTITGYPATCSWEACIKGDDDLD